MSDFSFEITPRMKEWFNTITKGLASQGWKRAWDPKLNRCVFRDNKGCRCAVGQLIPDEKYLPEMDYGNGGWSVGAVMTKVLGGELTGDEIKFLRLMQDLHDRAERPQDMWYVFHEMAYLLGIIGWYAGGRPS